MYNNYKKERKRFEHKKGSNWKHCRSAIIYWGKMVGSNNALAKKATEVIRVNFANIKLIVNGKEIQTNGCLTKMDGKGPTDVWSYAILKENR